MGSSESKPPPPPPTVTPAAIPTRQNTDVSIATSSICVECASGSCRDGKPCRLAVAPNKSAASVKIYRNKKIVDTRQSKGCKSLDIASSGIGNTVTIQEFADNLRDGKYSVMSPRGKGCSDVTVSPEQYGTILKFGDKFDIHDGDNWQKILRNITYVRNRELKNSFLSENKLTIEPNVSFEMSYNGKTFSITKMALFYPSPVRIENVQHDAIITLNDPMDNPEFVVMIPLVASSFVTESTAFFSRIGSALSKVVLPNQDEEVNVATGSDWSISKLFNTMTDGISIVDPFYTWTGVVDKMKTGRYIIMEKPMFISAGELTELRNIPPVDPAFGIPAIAEPVLYRKELCCKATKSTSAPVRESFVSRYTTPEDIMRWFIALLFVLAGTVIAIRLVTETPITQVIANGVYKVGKFLADQFKKLSTGLPGFNLNSPIAVPTTGDGSGEFTMNNPMLAKLANNPTVSALTNNPNVSALAAGTGLTPPKP